MIDLMLKQILMYFNYKYLNPSLQSGGAAAFNDGNVHVGSVVQMNNVSCINNTANYLNNYGVCKMIECNYCVLTFAGSTAIGNIF